MSYLPGIVIPFHYGYDILAKTVTSLTQQTYSKDQFEVIIAADANHADAKLITRTGPKRDRQWLTFWKVLYRKLKFQNHFRIKLALQVGKKTMKEIVSDLGLEIGGNK